MFACFAQLTCVLSLTSSSPKDSSWKGQDSRQCKAIWHPQCCHLLDLVVFDTRIGQGHIWHHLLYLRWAILYCKNHATILPLSLACHNQLSPTISFFKGHSRVLLNPSIGPIFCSLISANPIQENQQGCSPITNQCSWLMCYVQTSQFSALCTNFHCKKYLKQFPSIFFSFVSMRPFVKFSPIVAVDFDSLHEQGEMPWEVSCVNTILVVVDP